MLKTVVFTQCTRLSCSCVENAPVVLCLTNDTFLESGKTTLDGTLKRVTKVSGGCDNAPLWRYIISYESELLVDPSGYLKTEDVQGIFCKGCLTTWVEELIVPPTPAAPAWELLGNSGTVDGTNFLGTIDNVPHTIRVNNQKARKTIPDATAPIILDGKSDNVLTGTKNSGSVVSGGSGNSINGVDIVGNTPLIGYGVIGGGQGNSIISNDFAVIVGGQDNSIDASLVTTDYYDYTISYSCVIGGGVNNKIKNVATEALPELQSRFEERIIAGGRDNQIVNSSISTISGGLRNIINASFSTATNVSEFIDTPATINTISGGQDNQIIGIPFNSIPVIEYSCWGNTIGGGDANSIKNGFACTISGGESNIIWQTQILALDRDGNSICRVRWNTISGGDGHWIYDCSDSAVGGGHFNRIQGSYYGTISGGAVNSIFNTVDSSYDPSPRRYQANAISGGVYNKILEGYTSAILGGQGLQLGSDSAGYQAGSTRSVNITSPEVILSAFSNIFYTGDIDFWVGNTDSTARKVKFFEPNSDLTFATTNYSSIEAQAQASSIEYVLPDTAGTVGQSLKISAVAGNRVTLAWG